MFSGKTEELLRLLKRAEIAKLSCILVKPSTDTRDGVNTITSHGQRSRECEVVHCSTDLLELSKPYDFIAIDEAQFFDEKLVDVVVELANSGKKVVLSGLDMNYMAQPFGIIPQLMAVADEVVKLHAICTVCGKQAQYSKRIIENKNPIHIGAKESYTALCRKHFYNL